MFLSGKSMYSIHIPQKLRKLAIMIKNTSFFSVRLGYRNKNHCPSSEKQSMEDDADCHSFGAILPKTFVENILAN